MSKTLMKLTILVVVSLAVIGGIWGGLSATATAQTADEDALKAEVAAATAQYVQAFNTSDIDLLDTVSLQSDKATHISPTEPFRIDGWTDVRRALAGELSLPPGSFSLVPRQSRIDLIGDDVALWTGHFILNIRPPEGSPQTVNGRLTSVLQKVDGKWLIVHIHSSALP